MELITELTGIFKQSLLQEIITKEAMGLYRDDGLIVLNKINSQKMNKVRKKIIQVFKDGIGIITNLVGVNFWDIRFDLRSRSYKKQKTLQKSEL